MAVGSPITVGESHGSVGSCDSKGSVTIKIL